MAKIPLEQFSIRISPSEKKQLQELADERGKSLSEVTRLAIQAYLYAIRHAKQRKYQKKKAINAKLKSATNDLK